MVIVKYLELQPYLETLDKMQKFTKNRDDQTKDEIWFLEHHSVFTQGKAGKPEHIISPDNIPVVRSDRGGQVTYHGEGQLICYLLIDLKRKSLKLKTFIEKIEQAVIEFLKSFSITAHQKPNAPGVYVDNKKICSLGLRVKKQCTYHGFSLNINMDLTPFSKINPCGFKNLKITQTKELNGPTSIKETWPVLIKYLLHNLNYKKIIPHNHSLLHMKGEKC